MTALELEIHIVTVTAIGCLLAKAAKWLLEELQPVVLEYQKLRATIRKVRQDQKIRAVPEQPVTPGKPSPSLPGANETRSTDESNLAA